MFFKSKIDSLRNNKTSRYILYAFGEIIIVTIGVIIAINLNNYNNSNNADINAKKYISSIKEQILADKDHFSKALRTAEKHLGLLEHYFLHFESLDNYSANELKNIVNISLAYPFNERAKIIYETTSQTTFYTHESLVPSCKFRNQGMHY